MAGTRHAAAATVSSTPQPGRERVGRARRVRGQRANQREEGQRRAGAGEQAERNQRQALAQHHPQHARARRTERQADAEFPPPLLHGIADDARNPGGRDHQRQHARTGRPPMPSRGTAGPIVAERLQRAEVIDGLLGIDGRDHGARTLLDSRRAGSIERASASTAGCSGRVGNRFPRPAARRAAAARSRRHRRRVPAACHRCAATARPRGRPATSVARAGR